VFYNNECGGLYSAEKEVFFGRYGSIAWIGPIKKAYCALSEARRLQELFIEVLLEDLIISPFFLRQTNQVDGKNGPYYHTNCDDVYGRWKTLQYLSDTIDNKKSVNSGRSLKS